MSEHEISFEEAMKELEGIVGKLEKGELSLDESVEMFQKGLKLSQFCSRRLDEVQRKITILIEDDKGAMKEENYNTVE